MALRDFYPMQTPSRIHYCPVCRYKRAIPYREFLLAWQWTQIITIVIFMTWLFYRFFYFKTLVLIVPFYFIYEFSNRIFNRKNIICTRCNFDPIQYRSDPTSAIEVARQKLNSISLELEKENPGYAQIKKNLIQKKADRLILERSQNAERPEKQASV